MAKTPAKGVVSSPAVPPPVRIRQNVLNLLKKDPKHPILVFYGKAIAVMQAKSAKRLDDPLSWRYQAAIHDYPDLRLDPARSGDPNAVAGEPLPSTSQQSKFWRQCQHGSWFFLPWHRMYLHHFEKMIMGHVETLGGPSDWALPYWDYSASPAAALLPASFRSPVLSNGAINTQSVPELFVAQRSSDANDGKAFVRPGNTDISQALAATDFSLDTGNLGFGGPKVLFHPPGNPAGLLEKSPHNSMHGRVSGPTRGGFMGGFSTAPLDPIFWLHHCNIDRLWNVWLRDPINKHSNPTEAAWLNQTFDFNDAKGVPVTMTPKGVVDASAPPLTYLYEDELFGPPKP